MAGKCAESDAVTLPELYGHASSTDLLTNIIERHVTDCIGGLEGNVSASMNQMAATMMAHINSLVPGVSQKARANDDEHERELEEELETEIEREVQRENAKAGAEPEVPQVSQGLLELAQSGRGQQTSFPSLSTALLRTSFASLLDGDWDENVRVTPDFVRTVKDSIGDKDMFLRPVMWMLVSTDGLSVLVSNFEAEKLSLYFQNEKTKSVLQLVSPDVRPSQPLAFPSSAPKQCELPIPVHVFAGSLHGGDAFVRNVRAFLGLCAPQPASAAWRELFGQRCVIGRDGFVAPEFRDEVVQKLNGISLSSSFSKSPNELLLQLYISRHLAQNLQESSMGRLLGATNVCKEG